MLFFGRNVTAQNVNTDTKRYVEITEIFHFGDKIYQTLVVDDSTLLKTFDYHQFAFPQNVLTIVVDQPRLNRLITAIDAIEAKKFTNRGHTVYYIAISDDGIKKRLLKLEMDEKDSQMVMCLIFNDCDVNE